jgi:hypothetical protein
VPHAPQFAVLVCRSTQAPPQSVKAPGQLAPVSNASRASDAAASIRPTSPPGAALPLQATRATSTIDHDACKPERRSQSSFAIIFGSSSAGGRR